MSGSLQPEWISTGGEWYKFDRYEVRDGLILPVAGSAFQRYDVWQSYEKAREKWTQDADRWAGRKSAHESFLNVGGLIGMPLRTRIEGDSEIVDVDQRVVEVIVEWCNSNGLLGLLLHRTRQVSLWPRWTKRGDAVVPVAVWYQFVSGRWQRVEHTGNAGAQESVRPGDLVDRNAWEEEWPEPGFTTLGLGGSRYSLESSLGIMETHLPGLDRREDLPPLLSEAFWRAYAEPLDSVVREFWVFHHMSEAIADSRSAVKGNPWGWESLNRMLDGTTTVLGEGDSASPSLRWSSPSLYGYLAAMEYRDLVEQEFGRLAKCDVCKGIFFTHAHQQLYCSRKCYWKHNKRIQRANQAAGKTRSSRGQ